MQDTFISLGRGIDGMVGRMVDQFGESKGADRPRRSEGGVELLRYAVVCVASGRERVLKVDETLVTDGAGGADLERRLLAPFRNHIDVDYLRVHTRVLRRWRQRPAQEPAPARPAARPEPAPSESAPSQPVARIPRATPAATAVEASVAPQPAPSCEDGVDRRLVEALAEAGGDGLSMAQLVRKTGESGAELRQRLQRLAAAGTVRRAGDGLKTRYRLTDSQPGSDEKKELPR